MMRPILNYHAVGVPSSPEFAEWTVEPSRLRDHLGLLADRGLRGVTMAQALDHPSPDQVALTFDDGYRDFVTEAVPALREHNFRATLFVATQYIGDTATWLGHAGAGHRPMASWRDLIDIEADGFEIGSHSHTHPHLDLLDPQDVRDEIRAGKDALRDALGHDVAGFCYPHGFHDRSVRQAVIDAGFSYACAVRHKMSHDGDDRFALARIVVRRDDDADQIGRWLDGDDLRRRSAPLERSLAAAYRAYRWLRRRN